MYSHEEIISMIIDRMVIQSDTKQERDLYYDYLHIGEKAFDLPQYKEVINKLKRIMYQEWKEDGGEKHRISKNRFEEE